MADIDRRSFLQKLAALASGALLLPGMRALGGSDRLGETLPLRALGKTGEKVTMLGLGGAHVEMQKERAAAEMIELAMESGIRFFDTAVQYGNGEGEALYGRHLTPKYRDEIFLMTKTLARNAKDARSDLEDSLRRLKTDHLDLWQAHALESPEDVDLRAAEGVFEEIRKAKAEGKTRHLGFSGHNMPDAHMRALEITEGHAACQMPINAVDRGYRSFIENALPKAAEKGFGVLAMKTLSDQGFFGRNRWSGKPTGKPALIPDRISVREAMYFVWSLPVSVLITGADELEHLREKVRLAREFRELGEEERDAIFNKVADLAGKQVEFYKV